MAKDDTEEVHQQLAEQVIDLFLPDDAGLNDQEVAELEAANEPKIMALFGKMQPVDAAAVAVHVCYELDPEQIADFLALLEGTLEEGTEDPE